ncbi:hypothetical protein [Psychromarinibacter sp. S121]|uniref:hypothetical protein n=1 Tax=Psychromarinibacter sp. S121 TaxID=3415127 RepID=UPI003C7B62B5
MRGIRQILVAAIVVIVAQAQATAPALAQDRTVRLSAPAALVDSGLLQYALPRFSLKTQVKVQIVAPGEPAELALGDTGRAVFTGPAQVWRVEVLDADHAGADRLADWLASDVGLATITGYAPDGAAAFGPPEVVEAAPEEITVDTELARLGLAASEEHCGRCHVISEETRMTSIDSTPSFFLLRAFEDWQYRFEVFYVLNPHPAFTQVEEVTEPFPVSRPSPIVPVEMTLDELEAIVAYVAGLEPADLGAPLQHQ